MKKVINYIKDTKGELKHVSWPTRKQTIAFSLIVILISVVTAALLGFFDFIFSQFLEKFVL
jgi:preprotein translocase subunit SecE